MQPERLQMLGRAVTLILRQTVLGIELVEFFHPMVPVNLGQDRRSGNGNRAGVAMIQGLLFDGQVEFDGVRLRLAPDRFAISNEVFVGLLG